MALEPLTRESGHFEQRSRLLEEVCRSGDDDQPLLAVKARERGLIHRDDRIIVSPHDKQCRCPDTYEGRPGQVGAAAPRDHRVYLLGAFRRRDQRRGGPGAGAEVTETKGSCVRVPGEPVANLGMLVGGISRRFNCDHVADTAVFGAVNGTVS